jgi:TonB family protein
MRILFLLLFLIVSVTSYASKTFTYTLTVYSLAKNAPLAGMLVRCTKNDGSKIEAQTEKDGKVIFSDLTEKDYRVFVLDPTGEHIETEVNYYNPKKEDESEKVYLCYSPDLEKELIRSKTMVSVGESTETIVCDSINSTDAQFPGGAIEIHKFIAHNMKYPQDAIEKNISGRVYVSFVIEKDGSISQITIDRGVFPSLDSEAIRIIAYLQNWIPATCSGLPVRTRVRMPITFSIN